MSIQKVIKSQLENYKNNLKIPQKNKIIKNKNINTQDNTRTTNKLNKIA